MNTFQVESRGVDGLIYVTACDYFRAATYISEHEKRSPYYVNLAFSIELFIKCMDVTHKITFDANPPHLMVNREQIIHTRTRGHSLKDLFENLPANIKVTAETSYQSAYSGSLLIDLQEIQNTFVEWRYYFEQELITLPISTLENVAKFFKEFINEFQRTNNSSNGTPQSGAPS